MVYLEYLRETWSLESGVSTWSLDSGVYLKDFLLGVFYLESFDLESDFLIRERPLRPLFNKKVVPVTGPIKDIGNWGLGKGEGKGKGEGEGKGGGDGFLKPK